MWNYNYEDENNHWLFKCDANGKSNEIELYKNNTMKGVYKANKVLHTEEEFISVVKEYCKKLFETFSWR